MLAEISAGLGGLKTAFDIVQGLNASAKTAAINDIKIALGQHILEAQAALTLAGEAQATAVETIRNLEQEIVYLKDWSAEKQRYELKKFYPGTLAYVLKAEMANGEPIHSLCANCYEQDKKSVLQATAQTEMRFRIFLCPACHNKFHLGEMMADNTDMRFTPNAGRRTPEVVTRRP